MSVQHDFYLSRAQEARDNARSTTLENVRVRWLRSEATWNELAERSASVETMRARTLAQKVRDFSAVKSMN